MPHRYEALDIYRHELSTRLLRKSSKDSSPFRNKSVLDVGAGEGKESGFILREEPKFLILLDNNFIYLKKSRQALEGFANKYMLYADGHRLPFKEKSIDIVLIKDTFHHAVEPLRMLRDSLRVAKRTILIDAARKGIFRNLVDCLFIKFGIKQKYEIENGKELKFRANLREINKLAGEHNFNCAFYPYFVYYFEFYKNSNSALLKKICRLFFVLVNTFFHLCGNRVIIILDHPF